jgi:DNA polymerase III epsilon subunit-like protein
MYKIKLNVNVNKNRNLNTLNQNNLKFTTYLLQKMHILIFDTETTGLPKTKILNIDKSSEWPHVVQLSYIIYDTDLHIIIKIRDFIIRMEEGFIINEESIKFHAITNEISKSDGIDISKALEEFYKDIKTVEMVIAHNISFDSSVIKMELLRLIQDDRKDLEQKTLYKNILYEISYVTKFLCTMKETTEYCNILKINKSGNMYRKYPSLTELCIKLFNETPQNLHNALHDVIITLICFMKFNYEVDIVHKCVEVKNILNKLSIL